MRFFRGTGAAREPKHDEIWLSCPDDYASLPSKVQSIFKWGYEHGYDYVMKFDDDTALSPKRWFEGFHRCDFTGCREPACKTNEIQTPYGFAYVLNRKAMKLVIETPLPTHGNDEAWVSTVLYTNNVLLHHDQRYYLHRGRRPEPNPRTARAPKRDNPPQLAPPPMDAFAYCCYLNWKGFHATPDEENIREIHWLYDNYAKGLR